MNRILLVINAILTVPLGAVALISPAALFRGFGLTLDAPGALLARGYAASLIAYGTALFLLRGCSDQRIVNVLLSSAIAFNVIECAIQTVAGINGVASPMIWTTAITHGVLGCFCLYAVIKKTH
jgi:hypothetical protein